MGFYQSSVELQKQSLDILSAEEEKLEFKQLKCKIHLCLGLNQCALESYEMAVIMIGIAFGKSSTEQKVGDVLVAPEIIDYDVNYIGLDGIVDRGSQGKRI